MGRLRFVLLIALLCATGQISSGCAWADWTIETVDFNGDVGGYTSIALDSSNYPHISYYDYTNFNLKYARWNGTSWTIQTVDRRRSGVGGRSIVVDSSDYPHISYYNRNYNLTYARWNGTSWIIQTVASPGQVGYHTSIALDSSDYPHISYYDGTNENLKYARWTPSNEVPHPVSRPEGPDSGTVGISYRFSATTTDPDGDDVAFRFDWGDETLSPWTSFVRSGTTVRVSHSWQSEGVYQVRVKAKDSQHAESAWSLAHPITIRGVRVHPNPFSFSRHPQVTFTGALVPHSTIRIFTLTGQLVATITEREGKSTISWDGTNDKGDRLACGIYIYRIENLNGKIAFIE